MEFDLQILIAHLIAILGLPPFFLGVIAKTKAWFGGRKGPHLFQAYFDIIKLFRKAVVYSDTASQIFRIVPPVNFVLIILASLFFPLLGKAPLQFEGDVILFIYILALARFMIILSAMDMGSSFEGMGASRESMLGAFTELAFFLGWVVLSVTTNSFTVNDMVTWAANHDELKPVFFLLFLAFFLILLTENSRIPVDDPNTHLELTMVHEVMILDNSGPDLGLILYGASIKLFLFMALAASLLWPGIGLILKITGMAVGIGIVESVNARLKWIRIPHLLVSNFGVTIFALLVTIFSEKSF